MLIIRHRVNTLTELLKTPEEYGVEIDIRGYGDKLLLDHDPINPNREYTELEDYLKHFKHSFVIFNIKETGIEDKVINLAEKYNVKDYFLLDVEFPFIYRATRKDNFSKIAVRFSEAEPIEMALAQKGYLDWVWVDVNTRLPLDRESYDKFKSANFKICLVCPERWGRPEDIEKYTQQLINQNIKVDAVMTSLDYIDEWKNI